MHLENWKHIIRALIKARFTVAKANSIDCKSFALPPFSDYSNFDFCPPFKISASHWFRARTCCYSLCSNKLLLIISRIVFWQSGEPNGVLTRLKHCRKWRACQELLSAHCFHKKGSPAVCLFWATPVKVPRSPFGVWINCIKGHVYCVLSMLPVYLGGRRLY